MIQETEMEMMMVTGATVRMINQRLKGGTCRVTYSDRDGDYKHRSVRTNRTHRKPMNAKYAAVADLKYQQKEHKAKEKATKEASSFKPDDTFFGIICA